MADELAQAVAIEDIDFGAITVKDALDKKDLIMQDWYAQARALSSDLAAVDSIESINAVIRQLSNLTGTIHSLENQKAEIQSFIQEKFEAPPLKK